MFFKQIKHSIFTSILKGGLKIKNCYSTENLILFVGSNLISVSECMSCAWKPLILFFELKVIHHYQIYQMDPSRVLAHYACVHTKDASLTQ